MKHLLLLLVHIVRDLNHGHVLNEIILIRMAHLLIWVAHQPLAVVLVLELVVPNRTRMNYA